MIRLYCPRGSDGALALRDALREAGHKVLKTKYTTAEPGDLVVNWGARGEWPENIRVLNRTVLLNKYKELQVLAAAGVPVPRHTDARFGSAKWYARKFKHHSASDLLADLDVGDYYVEHVDTVREYRCHSYRGVSIRLAQKVPREVGEAHPVFRTNSAGWKFSYAPQEVPYSLRPTAHAAVKALGLDFGAVDIAVRPDDSCVVFEVNTAPGLEGGTIGKYAERIAAELSA